MKEKEKEMKFEIQDDVFIEVEDEHNFVVKSIRVIDGKNSRGKKAKAENIGKESEKVHGYYGKLGHALECASHVVLSRAQGWKDVHNLVQTLNRIVEKGNNITEELWKKKCPK